jgi:hypothetical protein
MGGVFTVPACWLPEYKPVMGMEDSIVWPFLIPSAGKDILQESPFPTFDIKDYRTAQGLRTPHCHGGQGGEGGGCLQKIRKGQRGVGFMGGGGSCPLGGGWGWVSPPCFSDKHEKRPTDETSFEGSADSSRSSPLLQGFTSHEAQALPISDREGGYPLPPWVRGGGGGCLSKIRKGEGGRH